MGASGAIIMSFFGAVFAALTLWWQGHVTGLLLVLPFLVFVGIGVASLVVLRMPGTGIKPSPREERAILWSTIAEGVGLFVAANIVINVHHPEWLLPAMAAVIGLHFLPIARAGSFTPFYVLGMALLLASVAGFVIGAPLGGEIAGAASTIALWTAALVALRRDLRARDTKMPSRIA